MDKRIHILISQLLKTFLKQKKNHIARKYVSIYMYICD